MLPGTGLLGGCAVNLWIFCGIFGMYFTLSSTVYLAGSWCPYQTEKVVPCRVRNGTEPYYGTNICWRNENGSYACSKKLMYRPKYTTTYKKITETKYKCCLGRDGTECENECFNCTAFRLLEYRIGSQEERLGLLEKTVQGHQEATIERVGLITPNDPFGFHRDLTRDNSVYPASLPGGAPSPLAKDVEERVSLACATLSLRVHTILEDLREMQNRIRFLESEVSRLNTQVEDETLNNNVAFDYSSSTFPENKDSSSSSAPPTTVSNKDIFTASTKSRMATTDEAPDTGDNNNNARDQTLGETERHFQEAHSHRHYHHHRHPHSRHPYDPSQNEDDITLPPHHPPHHHDHPPDRYTSSAAKTEGPFRVLEENLERGDIASTLNDDYGDEDDDNSTEQYADQLKGSLHGVPNATLSHIPSPLQNAPYP